MEKGDKNLRFSMVVEGYVGEDRSLWVQKWEDLKRHAEDRYCEISMETSSLESLHGAGDLDGEIQRFLNLARERKEDPQILGRALAMGLKALRRGLR